VAEGEESDALHDGCSVPPSPVIPDAYAWRGSLSL
jgi:hypothetical protein